MFRLIINGETITFESEAAMMQAAQEAQDKGLSVEDAREENIEEIIPIEGPQTEQEAAESEIIEEGFKQDFQQAAPSASVEPEAVAQEDTELPQEDTSLDLPKDDFQIKLDKLKSLKDRRAKSPDGTLPTDGESFEKLEEYENKKDFGIINSETGEVDEKLQAEVQEFEDFSQNKLNSGILQQLDVKGVSLQAKMQNGLQEAYRRYIKDNYKNFITTRTVAEVAVNTTKDKQMPNDFAIDQIVEEQLQTLQENQRNEKIAQEQKVGRGVSKNPTQKVISVIQNRIDAFPANEQLFGRTSQRLDAIDRKLAPGNLLTDNERIALEDKRRALLISSAEAFEKMNPPGSTNPYRDGFEYVGKTQKNKLTQFFNLETGAQVMPAKAALSNKKIIAAPAEMLTEAERLAALPREPLKAAFYYNALKETQINGALKKTFNFNPNKAYERRAQKGEGVGMGPMDKSRLRVYLESKGYTPDENGLYTNVTAEDLLPLKDMNLSGRFGMFSEDGGSILDDAFVPREGDLATPAMFIQNLAEERMRNSIEGNALNRAYLLNIDPGSEKLEAGDYVATFGKKALAGTLDLLPDTMTSRYIDELPLTQREMLDNSEQMLMDAGIEITEEQKETFARGYGMKSVEQLGDFAPMLINFFFLNKAAGAAGMTRMIGTLLKGGPKQKAMGLIFGALLEEVKFEAATYGEAKTLGGTGFFAGGQVANALLKGRMGALARKILGGAVGGTAGSETAKVAESMAEDLMGDKDFKTSMQEYYGDIDEVTERLIIDGIVFGVLGMTHAKKIDFMKQSTKQKLSSKLNREINDMSSILTPKELGKKKKLKAELDQDLALNNEAFSKLAIGDQVQNAKAARARLNELDSQLKNDPFEGGLMSSVAKFEMWTERGMLENIISRVEANKMAARKAISEQANNFKESIGKPDMPVIITENGEGMGLGNKGEFQFETVKGKPSILIDLSLYQPGVLSQEGFHAQMEFAFGEGSGLKKGLNLEVAKKLREKIEPAVEKALENERFVISDGEGGTKNGTFKEAIEDAYKEDPAKTDEEYVANVIEFLGNKKYRNLLLDNSLMGKLNKAVKNTAIDLGISKKNVDQNLTTAEQTLDFLYTLSDFSQGPGRGKKNFAAFKNLAIDGTKLVDMKTNTEITTAKEMQKDISASKEIKPEEKKDIFSKATKAYEDGLERGDTMDIIGVSVGYQFQPLVRSKLRSYLAVKSLENAGITEQQIEDIVSDVTLGSGKGGSQNIPGLVKSYKESGEASLTSYIFGQLNNKILGALQQPAYRDIFNTFSIDANPGQVEKLIAEGTSEGYVDLSSPEQNIRINRIKAEVTLKLPVELKEDINGIGERLLMSTPLKNIDAKQEGSIKLPSGKTAEIVISKSEQATIEIEGEPTETIRVRSPKILEDKFGTGKKSFVKKQTTKEKLYRSGIELIYPKLEKVVGGLKDNFTATPEYEAFIENAYPLFKNYLSQSAVNKRFTDFKEDAINKKTGEVIKKKTSAGGKMFQKKAITPEEWKEYFLKPKHPITGKIMRIDGRRRSIIEAFSGEFVFDSVMETLSKEAMRKQVESRQEDIGVDLLDNYVAVIAKEIDRGNPGVMASKVIKIANEFGVDPYTMLFDKNNNLRPIDEIAMMPGGPEALGELYRGAQAELTRQLQNRAKDQEINTVDKLDKYYKDNPELFTPEMREAVKEVRTLSVEDFKNFQDQTDFLVTLFPEKFSEFSLETVDVGVPNSLLSQIFSGNSRTNKATEAFYIKQGLSAKAAKKKATINREDFTEKIKGKIGTNYNAPEMKQAREAWEKVIKLAEENNIDRKITKKGVKVQRGITILKQAKEYQEKVEGIISLTAFNPYMPALTAKQAKAEISKLKGFDAYKKAMELQVATLDAILLTFGAASKMVKGTAAEQKASRNNIFKALGTMLLNNDKGFRNLSPEIYYEIREGGIRDRKNEHLLSKAEFATRVLIAFNEGRLNTLEEVKEVSSEYVSLVGERAVQKAADILMGPTAENNKEAKMLDFVKGETNREFSTSDLIKLDSTINLITGKSALQEMIEAQARKALNMPFRSATEALSNNNKILLESGMMTTDSKTTTSASKKIINLDQAFEKGRDPNKEPKGISVFDFDDTLARTKSNVLYTMPGGPSKVTEKEFSNLSKQEKVYYHGTSAVVDQKFVNKEIVKDFPEGASSFSVQMQGLGKHYTKSLDNAKSFIDHRNRKNNTGTVAAVSISANNPKQFKTYQDLLNDIKSTVKNKDISISERNKEYLNILKSEGFDSIIYKEGPSYNPGKKSLMAEAVIPFNSTKKLIGSADYNQRNEGIVQGSAVAVKQGKLNATEFAKKSEALEAKGAEFDFSEFSKVMQGKLGPLFSEAKKKEGKYTNKDVFVLTARPANSAQAIYEFLKSEGLEIPIDNIVGLGNGAAKAKAEWMIGKVAEGYNDFYFADDAIKNVEAVRDALGLFDVKSKVQQAIMASKKITLEKGLAEMIERKKGISSKEPISAAIASNLGKKKGRYDWFIPPNAEDFAGLMYKLYGKGKQGDKDMALIKEALIRPFNRAENAISTYKQTLGNDYSALESQMGDLKVSMSKETKASLEQANVNADQATRVFIYNKLGYKIPGLEKNEIENISRIVNGDARLSAYAEGVMGITKTKEIFPRPGDTWYSSNIRYELFKYSTEGVRGHFLKDWQKNADEMFTEENFNRIEAGYGKEYANNLKEMLSRMKTGKTRSADLGKDVQAGMDYVNGSVGVIMFLNTRSAVLQTISAVNYVNWSDNNPLQIGKAVAKPKEWGKTFMEIYNSDFLKQRRGGLEINVEEAEIAKAVERSKGNARNLFDSMIKIGFKPTQLADSFAIAFGGTPFLMNRTATYVKQGLPAEAARKRAFEDFREVSEEAQQSSRQDRVSNIQTGVAGRLIFAFANTPMQMTRMTKKATLDLVNGRGDAKTNISKMLYYGAVQSYIFYALQQSQFLRLFGGDDEDMTQEEKDFNKAKNEKKNTRIANSMFDSFISGSGSPGKVAITAKNTILKYYKEKEKGYKADYGNVINEALSISPPLSSKTKKIYSAFKTYKYYSTKQGQKELAEYGQYAFDNPMMMANAKVFSSFSNVPADRLLQKVNNLYSAFTDETLTPIQSAALAAGWDKWSLGLYDPDFITADEIAENKIKRKEQLKKEKAAKKKAAIESYNMEMSEPERRDILKVLSKKQQMDSLWNLNITKGELKALGKMKEIDRIEAIIKLQNKKQFYEDMKKTKTKREDSLK